MNDAEHNPDDWPDIRKPGDQSARIAELERRVEELTEEKLRVLRGGFTQICAYCGWEASQEGAKWEELQAHIAVCEKHPTSQLRAEVERLTKERDEMESYVTSLAGIDADRDRLTEENDNLRAQLAASEADRARIDKIEEMAKRGGPLAEHIDPLNDAAGNEHGVRVLVICLPYIATKRPETLREAIDALYTGPIDAPLPDAARKEEA